MGVAEPTSGSLRLVLEGNEHGPTVVDQPGVDDVIRAIATLDGVSPSELSVTNVATEGLHIVGGPDRFLCWLQHWEPDGSDLVIESARDPEPPAGVLEVVLDNGQSDKYPLVQTISREQAVEVALDYLGSETRSSVVRWEVT